MHNEVLFVFQPDFYLYCLRQYYDKQYGIFSRMLIFLYFLFAPVAYSKICLDVRPDAFSVSHSK